MANNYVESSTIAPYVLPMEDRVARLEGDMSDVKSLLSRLEPMIIRIDATLTSTLPHLATRAEVAAMRSEIHAGVTSVRSEIHAEATTVRSEIRAEVTSVRSEIHAEVASVRSEIRAEITTVRSEINKDISGLRADVDQKLSGMDQRLSDMTLKLSDMPTRIYMWGVLGVLITAYGAGLAALAVLK
jgi:hypothetical protein